MTIRHTLFAAVVATLATIAAATPALADGHDRATAKGVAFILSTQNEDGGFGPFGQSVDAILAIRAAGFDPAVARPDGQDASAFFSSHLAEARESPALAAKAALGAAALGLEPARVSGTDLIALARGSFDPETGEYASDAFSQALIMLGIACTGSDVPETAYDALRTARLKDGGWGFAETSEPDTTALVIQALLAGGIATDDADVEAALEYLELTQLPDGGWGYGESNTSSTAFVVQAMVAAGIEPGTRFSAGDPLEYLLSQQGDDGSFAGYDRAFATNQVLPALAGRSYCDAPQTAVVGPAPRPPAAGTGLAAETPTEPRMGADTGTRDALGLALVSLIALAALAAPVDPHR